jgi:hypothetical protein
MTDRPAVIQAHKYRPSNGTEGDCFIESWCDRCKRDEAYRSGEGDSCPIVANTLALPIDDPEYPAEWTYAANGQPICTAFEEVGTPDPPDPRQGDMFNA